MAAGAGTVGRDHVVEFTALTGSGAPDIGITLTELVPRVRNLDTAVDDGAVVTPVEIGNGRYSFIIRGAFTTAQGAGNYGWSVERTTAGRTHIINGDVRFFATDLDTLAAAVWDRVLTGATHNIVNSAGRRLRELSDFGIRDDGQAQAGGATTITLAATAPTLDDVLNGAFVAIIGGTGQEQVRVIVAYDGTTKVATVDRAWSVNPDATSDYVVGLAADSIPVSDLYNVIRDAILNDATRFAGADIAAIRLDTGTTIPARLTGIEGAGFLTGTDSLEAIRNRGDAAWITATGFSTHTAADVWAVATRELTGIGGSGIASEANATANTTTITDAITATEVAILAAIAALDTLNDKAFSTFNYQTTTPQTVRQEVWAEIDGVPQTSPTSATVELFDDAAVSIFSDASAAPDANGVFTFVNTPVALNAKRSYTLEVSVLVGSVTLVSRWGVDVSP